MSRSRTRRDMEDARADEEGRALVGQGNPRPVQTLPPAPRSPWVFVGIAFVGVAILAAGIAALVLSTNKSPTYSTLLHQSSSGLSSSSAIPSSSPASSSSVPTTSSSSQGSSSSTPPSSSSGVPSSSSGVPSSSSGVPSSSSGIDSSSSVAPSSSSGIASSSSVAPSSSSGIASSSSVAPSSSSGIDSSSSGVASSSSGMAPSSSAGFCANCGFPLNLTWDFYLDADNVYGNGTNPTNGSEVPYWTDLASPTGNAWKTTAGHRPTYRTNVTGNGTHNAVSFNGLDDFIFTFIGPSYVAGTPMTIFAVIQTNNQTTSSMSFLSNGLSIQSGWAVGVTPTTQRFYVEAYGIDVYASVFTWAYNSFTLFALTFS